MRISTSSNRHPEIDLLRTLAILLMVVYHGAYDLSAYYGWNIGVFEGGWLVLARTTATLFLVLSGISFIVAHERAKARGTYWKRHLRRGLQVLGAGMLVSAATWMMDPDTYVRFGILHLIGIGILLLPLCTRFKEVNIPLGAACIAGGLWIKTLSVSTSLLLPLGLTYPGFRSVDYFPLLPWFGVMLIGMGLGQLIYVRFGKSAPELHPFPRWLTWPGRHSLAVYLVHQPILLAILALILGTTK